MTLSSKINLRVSSNLSSALDLVNAQANLSKTYSTELDTGTAAGQADEVFSDTRTLLAANAQRRMRSDAME